MSMKKPVFALDAETSAITAVLYLADARDSVGHQ
jgi:hypothetical protein